MKVLLNATNYVKRLGISQEILFFLGFVLITVVLTFPWLLYFDRSVYGYGHPFYVIWRFWWNGFSAANGFNPGFTELLGAPDGSAVTDLVDPVLPFLLGNLLNGIVRHPVIAYNIIVFLSFPLSGYFAFLLFRHLTVKRLVSFFFALLYAFSPYHLAHLGQFSLASIQFFPLVILAFLKIREKPTLQTSIFLGLAVALSFLIDIYYGYFSLLLLAALHFFDLLFNFEKVKRLWLYIKAFPYYLLSGIISVLLALPFVFPLLLARLNQIDLGLPLITSLDDLIVHSARPWDYLLPSTAHPLLGNEVAGFKGWLAGNRSNYWFYLPQTTEATVYLGFAVFFLALAAAVYFLFKKRKDPRAFWIPVFFAVALLLFFISLPPDIFLGKNNERHYVLLSFRLHQLLPMFRAYSRLGILVLLLFLALAAWLTGRVLDCRRPRWGRAVFLFIVATASFEFLNNLSGNLYVFDRTSNVYQWLAKQPGNFIVAELPEFRSIGNCSACRLFQPVHGKELYGPPGLIYYDYYKNLIDNDASYIPYWGEREVFRDRTYRAMKSSGVKYFVVHTLSLFRHPGKPFTPIAFDTARLPEYFRPVQTFPDGIIYELVQ